MQILTLSLSISFRPAEVAHLVVFGSLVMPFDRAPVDLAVGILSRRHICGHVGAEAAEKWEATLTHAILAGSMLGYRAES